MDLKLECLKLAIRDLSDTDEDVVGRAEKYWQWLSGSAADHAWMNQTPPKSWERLK